MISALEGEGKFTPLTMKQSSDHNEYTILDLDQMTVKNADSHRIREERKVTLKSEDINSKSRKVKLTSDVSLNSGNNLKSRPPISPISKFGADLAKPEYVNSLLESFYTEDMDTKRINKQATENLKTELT